MSAGETGRTGKERAGRGSGVPGAEGVAVERCSGLREDWRPPAVRLIDLWCPSQTMADTSGNFEEPPYKKNLERLAALQDRLSKVQKTAESLLATVSGSGGDYTDKLVYTDVTRAKNYLASKQVLLLSRTGDKGAGGQASSVGCKAMRSCAVGRLCWRQACAGVSRAGS